MRSDSALSLHIFQMIKNRAIGYIDLLCNLGSGGPIIIIQMLQDFAAGDEPGSDIPDFDQISTSIELQCFLPVNILNPCLITISVMDEN